MHFKELFKAYLDKDLNVCGSLHGYVYVSIRHW